MHTYEEIEHLVEKYKSAAFFTGGVCESKIKDAQQQLGVSFPEQYKWFLSKYGHGGVNGSWIEGIGKSSEYPVVEQTKSIRKYSRKNLNNQWVIIYDVDEYYYCLSCEDGKVRDWDLSGKTYYEIDSFLDFLYTIIMESVDNDGNIYRDEWKKIALK
ncbi:SMI1/KNR4 family protein [Endomicrobium proavitum]|uniref:Putative Antitoxin YobK n=1 Tax=Endomicrobium proavitum TaxID=1408281 RepID=A0A0G3WHR9_9BACT|nr:SMI1/KNR4 family protein [Endomicrobium proavitum]AKL97873.1 putative Antitoxin YobK [Endomicrobium proavitum]